MTPVAVPDPPLLNVWGVHEPSFLRAIVRLRTEDGLEGLGEGPGGGLFVQELRAATRHVVDADPFQIERLRALLGERNPRVFAAIEIGLLDLHGKAIGRPVYELLGGPVRRRVPFAAYMFWKEAGDDHWGRALTPDELVRQAERFHELFGMTVFKLKGGVLDPGRRPRRSLAPRPLRATCRAAHRSQRGLVGRDLDPRRREAADRGSRIPGGSDCQHRGHGPGGAAYARFR